MDKLRRPPRKIDRRIIYADKIRPAVANGLTYLFGRVALLFLRFAADKNNCFCVTNFFMCAERDAEIFKNRSKVLHIRNSNIIRANSFVRKTF